MNPTQNPSAQRRSVLADFVFLVSLAAFIGCLHHALRADRPLFTAPRNPGYADLLIIGGAQVRSGLGQSGTVLVDARPEENFRQGTIPTSLSLPLHSRIEQDVLQTLLSAERVITFCSNVHCNASKELGVILRSRGVEKVYVFPGGMEEWRQAGYPVATKGKG